MGRTALIVGSGPAAAGAALALLNEPDVTVTVIDIGGQLEPTNAAARARLGEQPASLWQPEDLALISRLPEQTEVAGVPEKRSYGSDFPFRDLGQLQGVDPEGSVNQAVVSSAFGGFSNVWGAQVMPFPSAAFRDWPFPAEELHGHYSAVLGAIPYAAEADDLQHQFPLLGKSFDLPKLSSRSAAVLGGYERHRARLNSLGVTAGRARLAMSADQCIRCGLCMTGCPYRLIYSAADTWRKLVNDPRVSYRSGLLATQLREEEGAATVVARDVDTGEVTTFKADRVFVGCGAIGSSRLVMGSLGLFGQEATVRESAQFVLPFFSQRAVPDPQVEPHFTLNQFNVAVSLDAAGYDLAHLHFYTFDQSFKLALPRVLRRVRLSGVRSRVLRHLSVALGYVPSWASPTFALRADAPAGPHELPRLRLSPPQSGDGGRERFMRSVVRRLVKAGRALDCWPLLPVLSYAAPGKSYHFGGTFPHVTEPSTRFASDPLGRVAPWTRIHLVDASVFPNVAATTFTLTIMANAHRIASELVQGRAW